MLRKTLLGLLTALLVAIGGPARAGIPVIDVTAVANLIQQIAYWEEQITAMANELNQLRQTYDSMNGNRGMEALLPMTDEQRNYLPPDYEELMRTVDGSSAGYAGLSAQIQTIMAANAVLTATQLNKLSPEARQTVENGRRSAAMLASFTQAAYENTSLRFSALQQLIAAIGSASDPKAIDDLRARVNAEQLMLQTEQTKLQSLSQVAHADQLIQQQRLRERSASDVGSVNSLSVVPY